MPSDESKKLMSTRMNPRFKDPPRVPTLEEKMDCLSCKLLAIGAMAALSVLSWRQSIYVKERWFKYGLRAGSVGFLGLAAYRFYGPVPSWVGISKVSNQNQVEQQNKNKI